MVLNQGHFFRFKYLLIICRYIFQAIVVDYIRPSLFNGSTVIPNIAVA